MEWILPLVVTVFGALWTVLQLLRERQLRSMDHSSATMARLIESDRLVIEHPEILQYYVETAHQDPSFFRSDATLQDERFFKAKSSAYSTINHFDDILSIDQRVRASPWFLRPSEAVLEIDDWKQYMIRKLSHPLYRSILASERMIFGKSLQDFWASIEAKVQAEVDAGTLPDRFCW